MTERLVIVGGGMAAARLVEELTARAPGRLHITLIGEEVSLPYNRVLLSALLARDVDQADLELKPKEWWESRNVTVVCGTRVTEIDTGQRSVQVQSRPAVPYDTLVLATGSEPIQLPLPGVDLPGVETFRTQNDVSTMLRSATNGARAVVIGGGLLGLEAAYGLARCGAAVTVAHLMDRLMERQLDPRGGAMLKTALEARGIDIVLEAESTAIEGMGKPEGVRLSDGRVLPADIVIMAAGIRPRISLARSAGLAVGRGILVEDHMQTSMPGVYALGECAEHRGVCYGLVEPAYEQARVLGAHLTGTPSVYEGSLLSTNLKVSGVDVFSAGDFLGAPGTEPILLADDTQGIYRKLVVKDGRLSGAVLIGDTADALWYLDLIRSGAPIAAMRGDLIFGQAYCAGADDGSAIRAEAA